MNLLGFWADRSDGSEGGSGRWRAVSRALESDRSRLRSLSLTFCKVLPF